MENSPPLRRVLLTGATGFLGSAIARALHDAGHEVRAFARPSAPRALLEGLPVTYAAGDLTDPASVGRAVRGCDAAIHCAADYRIWVPDPEAIDRKSTRLNSSHANISYAVFCL